jgi:hypothetical protein
MPRGSLYDLLHTAGGLVVDTAQAVRFALDIAKGMAYLHSLERIIPEYFLNSFHIMVCIYFIDLIPRNCVGDYSKSYNVIRFLRKYNTISFIKINLIYV